MISPGSVYSIRNMNCVLFLFGLVAMCVLPPLVFCLPASPKPGLGGDTWPRPYRPSASSSPTRRLPKQTVAAKSPHADKTNKQTSSGKSPHHRGTQYGHYWKAATQLLFSGHNGRKVFKKKKSTAVSLAPAGSGGTSDIRLLHPWPDNTWP